MRAKSRSSAKQRAAGDLGAAVDAAKRRADDAARAIVGRGRGRSSCVRGRPSSRARSSAAAAARRTATRVPAGASLVAAQDRARPLHRLDDLVVAGAAAEVAGQRLAISASLGGRVGLEQRLRRHQDPRRAVAALRGAEVGEGALQRMELVAERETFDGLDRASLHLGGEDEAREHRPAVDQHRAGAALAELAAVLGAGEPALLAQDLEQGVVGGEGDHAVLAVDAQRHGGDAVERSASAVERRRRHRVARSAALRAAAAWRRWRRAAGRRRSMRGAGAAARRPAGRRSRRRSRSHCARRRAGTTSPSSSTAPSSARAAVLGIDRAGSTRLAMPSAITRRQLSS